MGITNKMVRLESESSAQNTPQEKVSFFGSTQFPGIGCDVAQQKFVGMLSIRATETEGAEDGDINESERAPIVLVAVVDKSGSMSGAKMKSLKKTLEFIVAELGKNDMLGIVEYDTHVSTSLPMTKMDQNGKQLAQQVVTKLETGSATNLSGGLLEGLRLIPNDLQTNVVSSVLLLTDGLANHGITSTQGIISMIHKAQADGYGKCTVNTFGFGSDHDAKMLKDLSDAAEGMYYFIENEDSIATAFADCLGGLLSVVAQGIEIKLESVDGHLIDRVWTVKPVSELTAQRVYRISMGDLQEGEERDVPFEISLPIVTASGPSPIARATMSFYDVKAETMRDISCDILLERPTSANITEAHRQPNMLVDRNCNRCKGGKAMEEAAALAEKNQLPEARELLSKAMAEIQASASAGEDFCVILLKEMKGALDGMVDRREYQARGQYQMNYMCKAMNMQRCAAKLSSYTSEESAAPMFETKARRMMKSKARK